MGFLEVWIDVLYLRLLMMSAPNFSREAVENLLDELITDYLRIFRQDVEHTVALGGELSSTKLNDWWQPWVEKFEQLNLRTHNAAVSAIAKQIETSNYPQRTIGYPGVDCKIWREDIVTVIRSHVVPAPDAPNNKL